MSDHSLIKPPDWKQIIAAVGDGKMPMPFVQEIFLIKCQIAGTTHVADIAQKTMKLTPGTPLAFRREPDNQYDKLAISILNPDNEKIGFVPRGHNEILARLMDGGKLVFGKVENLEVTKSGWHEITIKVFMKDV